MDSVAHICLLVAGHVAYLATRRKSQAVPVHQALLGQVWISALKLVESREWWGEVEGKEMCLKLAASASLLLLFHLLAARPVQ